MTSNILKTTLIACAVAALGLGTAIAQPRPDQRGGPDRDRDHPQEQRGRADAQDQRHDRGRPGNDRGNDHRDARADRSRGAGPDHNFYTGRRLPPAYHQRRYVVDDWRGHQLRQPPRGYHWVQTGGDYLLVAVATGLIAQIVLSH